MLAALFLSAVDKHFRIRSARSGFTGNPPVVFFGQEENFLFRDSALFPGFKARDISRRVVVARKNGHRKIFYGNIEVIFSRQKFIAPRDCFFVEVIAQRPVAEHFEKRKVRKVAYFVYISRANALLNVRQPRPRRVLFAEQVRNKRVHSRSRKENGRVVFRNKACRGYYLMPLGHKKVSVHISQLLSSQFFHCLSPKFIYN